MRSGRGMATHTYCRHCSLYDSVCSNDNDSTMASQIAAKPCTPLLDGADNSIDSYSLFLDNNDYARHPHT